MSHERLRPSDTFIHRHIGPSPDDIAKMLATLGLASLDELTDSTVPANIRHQGRLDLGPPRTEHAMLAELRETAKKNRVLRSFIGQGYYDTITPPVILRNILENPGWYTQYTPYQAEIAQGRLEALLNFQTMVADLCGMTLANASLLDEGTAAAEAMTMCQRIASRGAASERKKFFVADDNHPQTIAIVETRAEPLGIEVVVGPVSSLELGESAEKAPYFGVLLAYPATDGRIEDYHALVERAHEVETRVVMATDLLALTLLKTPGELGADIAIGSSQRFGVPLGFGGPHAAFLATDAQHSRHIPGRIIGQSKDAQGKPAMRLALQTREQHIRRDRATSNICTAQVLLAVTASMYAVYHGPEGLRRIAERVRGYTLVIDAGLKKLGYTTGSEPFFDTLRVRTSPADGRAILAHAESAGMNLRAYADGSVGISCDETTTEADVDALFTVFAECKLASQDHIPKVRELAEAASGDLPPGFARGTKYLTHPVFHQYKSETDLLRYMHKLESRDLSLTSSMIALGSCTMKLNATSEMIPITWPELGRLHPYAPASQTEGYAKLFADLEGWLAEITGFAATSLQPNAGAQGEYAGLLTIRAYHVSRGDKHRDVCLIPTSAHGTNPASAALAGMRVVAVACDERGNVDVSDLRAKASQHKAELAALMITYPSTHGVFEESIREICDIVHHHGGQVYMDGANMNAQVGLCRPGDFGPDVCHLNLHKTFCIPHGGGGPGMGPICVAKHLAPFLPVDPLSYATDRKKHIGPVNAAAHGSASILPIPYVYIALMGAEGLKKATQCAILNANYMAKRLEGAYEILYRGKNGRVAHEFIADCRQFKKSAGIEVEDIAKRLIDYGFHAPTMSFPVPGTLMIEPTESEPLAELDRFCDAMLAIREEIRLIEEGKLDKADNPLKNAPHTAETIAKDEWKHPYSREVAAYPAPWLRDYKFWPAVSRVDNAYGDRHLVCTCPPIEAYAAE